MSGRSNVVPFRGETIVTAPLVVLRTKGSTDGRTNANMRLGWKPTPELLELLHNRGFAHAHLLITIRTGAQVSNSTGSHFEWRDDIHYLVPLEQGLQNLTFQRPGLNVVVLTIVDMAGRSAQEALLDMQDQQKCHHFTNDHEQKSLSFAGILFIETNVTLEVTVDEKAFAQEPPQWQQRLVEKFCQFAPPARNRWEHYGLLACSFGLILACLTLGVIFKVLAMLIILLGGIRQLNWKGGLNPFNWSNDGWPLQPYEHYTSIWFQEANGRKRHWAVRYIFNLPVALFLLVCDWVFVYGILRVDWSFWPQTVGYSLVHLFAVWALLALVVGLLNACGLPRRELQSMAILNERTSPYRQLEELAGQDDRPALTVGALPRSQRTFRRRLAMMFRPKPYQQK